MLFMSAELKMPQMWTNVVFYHLLMVPLLSNIFEFKNYVNVNDDIYVITHKYK